jgi:hypothetical protein
LSNPTDTFSDCQALLDAGFKEDGIYTIHPYQNDEGVKVFCDMTKHTGWIVSTTCVYPMLEPYFA